MKTTEDVPKNALTIASKNLANVMHCSEGEALAALEIVSDECFAPNDVPAKPLQIRAAAARIRALDDIIKLELIDFRKHITEAINESVNMIAPKEKRAAACAAMISIIAERSGVDPEIIRKAYYEVWD